MIQMHIGTKEESQAFEIVDFLEDEKLILETIIVNGTKRVRKDGKASHEPYYLILGKTKALLFDTIDKVLRQKYSDDLPLIYSTPIVYMDWDQTVELKEKTAKV